MVLSTCYSVAHEWLGSLLCPSRRLMIDAAPKPAPSEGANPEAAQATNSETTDDAVADEALSSVAVVFGL